MIIPSFVLLLIFSVIFHGANCFQPLCPAGLKEDCKESLLQVKNAEGKLVDLIEARVCTAKRDAAVTAANNELESVLGCTETEPSTACDKLVEAAEDKITQALKVDCPTPEGSITTETKHLRQAFLRARRQFAVPELPYKTIVIEPMYGKADATIAVLHGFNFSIANELLRVFNTTMSGSPRGVRYVMMQAHPRGVNPFFKTEGNAWFDSPATPDGDWDVVNLQEAAKNLSDVARVVHSMFSLDEDRLGFVGFSMGSIVSGAVYLTQKVAAVAMLSGFCPAPLDVPDYINDKSKDAPLLMVNGMNDEFVKLEWSLRFGEDVFRENGRKVTHLIMPGLMHSLQPFRTDFLSIGVRFVYDAMKRTQDPEPNSDLNGLGIAPVVWSANYN